MKDLLVRRINDFYRYETSPLGEVAVAYRESPDQDSIISLIKFNQTGTKVWELCDGEHTVRQIIDTLQAIYPDVDSARVEADVLALLNDLEEKDLLIIGFDSLHPLLFQKGQLRSEQQ